MSEEAKSEKVAPKQPASQPSTPEQSAGQPSAPAPESLSHRIAGAFKAAIDTVSEAEQLHRRLDPDPARGPDPE
jgi:hypothetical protein